MEQTLVVVAESTAKDWAEAFAKRFGPDLTITARKDMVGNDAKKLCASHEADGVYAHLISDLVSTRGPLSMLIAAGGDVVDTLRQQQKMELLSSILHCSSEPEAAEREIAVFFNKE